MKILHVTSFGYDAGGSEKSISRLKRQLTKKGHDVRIFSSDYAIQKDTFADYTFKHKEGLIQILLRLFNPYAYNALKNALNEFKPDIIHFHRMDFLSPSVIFLAKNYPTVMTIHGPEDFISSSLIWFMPHSFFKSDEITKQNLNTKGILHYLYHTIIQKHFYTLGLRRVTLFISPSKGYATDLDKNIKPMQIIHNGVELLHYSKKSCCTYSLLYVGRLDSTKGTEYIITALPKILEKYPKTTLTIVGEGIFKNELISLVNKYNIQNHVQFVGWQKKETIEKYYQNADIVIVPSIWPEPFGLVGPEAMSTGRPIIGTRVGGIPDWLENGKTGYLIDPKDATQIAEKVIHLFSNEKLLKKMGENARKKAKEFSIENHAINIENMYTTLLQNTQKEITKKKS